jgi:hypothetical protein
MSTLVIVENIVKQQEAVLHSIIVDRLCERGRILANEHLVTFEIIAGPFKHIEKPLHFPDYWSNNG